MTDTSDTPAPAEPEELCCEECGATGCELSTTINGHWLCETCQDRDDWDGLTEADAR